MPEEAAGSANSLASGSGAGGWGGTGAAARDTRAEIELVRAAAVGARGAHERPHSNGDTNVGAASSQSCRRISLRRQVAENRELFHDEHTQHARGPLEVHETFDNYCT
jgi:hypothetical protein